MEAAVQARPVYRVSCAGCGEGHQFRTAQEIAAWTAAHKCWGDTPRD